MSVFEEAACPLCLTLGWVSERVPTLTEMSGFDGRAATRARTS